MVAWAGNAVLGAAQTERDKERQPRCEAGGGVGRMKNTYSVFNLGQGKG